ncbi:unnamed protein product [Nezara viridula]|uniref:Uncharacterized protein n=1 Tax=Nezara viridula TaxID=85310 RepID=A0A9P0MP15_NEZVI|nr:unnamed protein product [Nezara viridula]
MKNIYIVRDLYQSLKLNKTIIILQMSLKVTMITEATMATFAAIWHSGVMAINMVFQATMVSVAFVAFLTNMNLLARLCRVPPRSEVEGGGVRPPNILLGGVQKYTKASPSFFVLQ